MKSTLPQDIVNCISTVAKIIECGLDYLFTDGHAVALFTSFYDSAQINNINQLVDFNAVRVKYWKNENDLDLKRRKEAEFLVGSDIPVHAIVGYIVYNEAAKLQLLGMGIPEKKIIIKGECYF